ncbi:MAG: hypothetical protein JST68_15175 [Bacteroidetes bacterium]|nr:hypothetical protein [Bacteroidota bacterium]
MFKKIHWSRYLLFSTIGAILYCIAIFYLLKDTSYSRVWLIYLGNALFMLSMAAFVFVFNSRRGQNASSMTMLAAVSITTVMGVIISCLLAWNAAAGFFISIIFPFALKGDQTKERVNSKQAEL